MLEVEVNLSQLDYKFGTLNHHAALTNTHTSPHRPEHGFPKAT